MKKYNRANKKWFIVGLVLPILLFFVSVNVAYAYFTAVANSRATASTPIIKISFQEGSANINSTAITGSSKLIPGETLTVSGKVNNSGDKDVYAIITFKVKITKQNGLTETAVSKYYSLVNSTLREIKGSTGNFSRYAFTITADETTSNFSVSHNFNFNKYNNSYKNAQIHYELTADAIQKDGIDTNITATDIIMDGHKTSVKQLGGVSTQNGTPTPDSPVEIKSVGDKTKNLFNAKAIKNSNIKVNTDGSAITMPVATSGNGYLGTSTTLATLCPSLKVGDEVIYRFDSNTETNKIIYLAQVSDLWYVNTTRVITPEMLNSEVVLYANRYSDEDYTQKIIYNFQMELGTTATAYEPYGYRIPISQEGPNLLGLPNNFQWTGTYTLNVEIPAGTYTLASSSSVLGGGNSPYIYFRDAAFGTSLVANGISKTVTLSKTETTIYIYSNDYNYNGSVGVTSSVQNLRLFKPHSADIYLNEPLRSIGDVYDYIDLQTGKVVRNVRSLTLNISDMNNSESYPGWSNTKHIQEDYPNRNDHLNSITSIMCNITTNSIGVNTNYGNSILWLSVGTFNLTQTQWKETYAGLEINICYGLPTPTKESINIPDLSWLDVNREFTIGTEVQPKILYNY